MIKKILIVLSLFLLCPACGRAVKKWQKSTLLYFDTVCEIHLFCSASDFASSKLETKKIFENIEIHFSPGARSFSSPQVIFLYKKALDIYRGSSGCFDITVAPLSRLWGFLSGSFQVPSLAEIQGTLEHVGMDKIILQSDGLCLPAGSELDWGGIAKGFGIDLASQALIQMGIEQGFINAGGDLYCWGLNPDAKPWQIGIKHPRESGVSAILSISDTGAATTGDYQRFFIQNNIRYHHVFDPKSGYPAKGKQSVTVVGPETLVCDALSTALFVSQQPEKILKNFPEYGAVIIDSGGEISRQGKSLPLRMAGLD
jgi:thiamine biosynthesis lipoprotein